MKIWITRYALTKGIIEVEGVWNPSTPEMVAYKREGFAKEYAHKPQQLFWGNRMKGES